MSSASTVYSVSQYMQTGIAVNVQSQFPTSLQVQAAAAVEAE